jgi:uncharacterized membrane protein YraQ (UPF0718 family)
MPIIQEVVNTLLQASPYILLGLFFSGIIQSFVPREKIAAWIGKNNFSSVLISAIGGIPLPLCSCGVIPMAMSLRKSGASRGATTSFLIATPETGLDSIFLSFALLDPLMAIFRPLAAFATAIIAGTLETLFDKSKDSQAINPAGDCCQTETSCCKEEQSPKQDWSHRIQKGFHHSFVTVLSDIMGWLILGLVISGIISYFVPTSVIEKFLGNGLGPMLLMLLIGLPLYVCASASTPIAASLLLKGASPAVVLVFLLAGPATNLTTMLMVNRFLGTRALIIYLSSIAACSITFAYLLNYLYALWQIDIRATVGQAAHCIDPTWQIVSAVCLLLLMVHAGYQNYLKKGY